MRQLVKITFINSADYDYFELMVDGDVAVYGINDGGKTTCTRAVMYGEHGSVSAMNFGPGENIDYYFHKGQNEGLLIYDYVEVRPDGMILPYCLIISSQHIHFVTAAFNKKWVLMEDNKFTTNWSKIRTNIEQVSGDVQVMQVSSKRNLEIILQGTYNGRDDDLRRMSKQFSIFNGRDGKNGAVAKIIESLWKNGAMEQRHMKRIIIDRAEMDKVERLEREPSFDVSSARNLSDGFDDGWNDFSKYMSGELPTLMNQISEAYKEHGFLNDHLLRFPSIIHSMLELNSRMLENSITEKGNLDGEYKKQEEKNQEAKERIKTSSDTRSEEIGGLKIKIQEAKNNFNKYTEKEWETHRNDINDLTKLGSLTAEITSLEKAIDAIKKNDEEYTKALVEQINTHKKNHENLEKETNTKIANINQNRYNDEKIKDLESKKANVKTEAESNEKIKAERQALATENDLLKQEQKDIERAKDSLAKINKSTSLVDRFESGEDLSFLGKIGHEIISRFFRLVYVFICKELFGLDDLSEKGIESKQAAFDIKKEKYNQRVRTYQTSLSKEVTRLSSIYEDQIASIIKGYKDQEDALVETLKTSKEELDIFIKEKEKEIENIRAAAGIDVELLAKNEKDLETKQARVRYLTSNATNITNLKLILDEYGKISEYENQLSALINEHNKKSKAEKEEEKRLDAELSSIKNKIEKIDSNIRDYSKDLQGYKKKLPQLSAGISIAQDVLEDMIARAQTVEMNPDQEKTLCDCLDDWSDYSEKLKTNLTMLRSQCLALQAMLSPKDFFEFSIKPEDSLATDADILRVAGIVNRRNNATSDESITPFLNNWRRTWNEYLRWIYKIGERATNLSNVIETARKLQSFVNRHNEAHSIESIEFEIESGSDNPIVTRAIELKDCLDSNGVDIYSVDVTEGIDSNLFKLETLSENLRRKLVNIMSGFTKALSEYKYDAIPPEDFFTLYTCIKEENKPKIRLLNVSGMGSTGTGLTAKAILTICFVGEALRQDKVLRTDKNAIHVFVDEFGRIDIWNKNAIKKMCQTFGVRLFSAEPYASNESGGVKYGYSLNYDKKTHHRDGKLIKERRLKPVETSEN